MNYDAEKDDLFLSANDVPFELLAYQSAPVIQGPQNIESGCITINKKLVHSSFTQYGAKTFEKMREDNELTNEPTTEIIVEHLDCTSTEVLNSFFSDVCKSVDPKQGIKKLEIDQIKGKCELMAWPFSQLAAKCENLEDLKVVYGSPIAENNAMILDFVG